MKMRARVCRAIIQFSRPHWRSTVWQSADAIADAFALGNSFKEETHIDKEGGKSEQAHNDFFSSFFSISSFGCDCVEEEKIGMCNQPADPGIEMERGRSSVVGLGETVRNDPMIET